MNKDNFYNVIRFCMFLILLGIVLNATVIRRNDGRMPVNYYEVYDDRHVIMTPDTVYSSLGDRITFGSDYMFSIGDILIISGIALELFIITCSFGDYMRRKK